MRKAYFWNQQDWAIYRWHLSDFVYVVKSTPFERAHTFSAVRECGFPISSGDLNIKLIWSPNLIHLQRYMSYSVSAFWPIFFSLSFDFCFKRAKINMGKHVIPKAIWPTNGHKLQREGVCSEHYQMFWPKSRSTFLSKNPIVWRAF